MRGSTLRILMSFIVLLTACTANVISPFTNPNSDSALYEKALININAQNWTGAITDIQAMSVTGQAARTTMFTFATALAGQCGFQLLPFMQGMQNALGGGGTPSALMLTLMQSFQNTTVNMLVPGATAPVAAGDSTTSTYCSWAQQVMDNIQTTYGAYTSDEQTFVVFFSLAKIGMILKSQAALTNLTSGGKLIADPGFNSCSSTILPDFYAAQIATGLSVFLNNYQSISLFSVLVVNGVSLSTLLCGNITPYLDFKFCSHLTPATITAADIKNIRGLITTSTTSIIGLGAFTLLDKVEGTSQASEVGPAYPAAIWQCTNTAYTSPTSLIPSGTEGLLNCCQ